MQQKVPLSWRIMPFISLIIVISLIVVGIVLFSYVLVIVAGIMLVAWLVGFVRMKLFRSKKQETSAKPEEIGRVFDQDDFK